MYGSDLKRNFERRYIGLGGGIQKEKRKPKVRPAKKMAVSSKEISIFQRFGPAFLVWGANDIAIRAIDIYGKWPWADSFTHMFLGMALARMFKGLRVWSFFYLLTVSICIEVLQFYFKMDYAGVKDSIGDVSAAIIGYLFIQGLCWTNSKSVDTFIK